MWIFEQRVDRKLWRHCSKARSAINERSTTRACFFLRFVPSFVYLQKSWHCAFLSILKTSLSYWNRDKRCWNISCLQPVTSVPCHDQPSFTSHPAGCNTAARSATKKTKVGVKSASAPWHSVSNKFAPNFHFTFNFGIWTICINASHTCTQMIGLSECGAVEANLQKESSAWMRQPCSAAHKRNIHESNLFTMAVIFWPNEI